MRAAEQFGFAKCTPKKIHAAAMSNVGAHLEEEQDTEGHMLLSTLSFPLVLFPDELFHSNTCGRGRKPVCDRAALGELTANIPLDKRGTHCNHAAHLGMSPTTSWRLQHSPKSLPSEQSPAT